MRLVDGWAAERGIGLGVVANWIPSYGWIFSTFASLIILLQYRSLAVLLSSFVIFSYQFEQRIFQTPSTLLLDIACPSWELSESPYSTYWDETPVLSPLATLGILSVPLCVLFLYQRFGGLLVPTFILDYIFFITTFSAFMANVI